MSEAWRYEPVACRIEVACPCGVVTIVIEMEPEGAFRDGFQLRCIRCRREYRVTQAPVIERGERVDTEPAS